MTQLTQKKIDQLKQKLEEDLLHILDEAHEKMRLENKETLSDLAGEASDQGDESVTDFSIDMNNAIIVRRLRQVRETDAALQRIQKGGYGTCANCGCDIDHERLSAYPSAERCILCQSHHEKTFAHEARFVL